MIDLKSISKCSPKKPRIVVYGPSGIGKTTFGASAPNPVFIITEDGLGDITVPHFPLAKTYDDVMGALATLINDDHDFKTLVVDSLDWLENLVWKKTCERLKINSIEDIGYGRGYVETMTEWGDFIDALTCLRDRKDMYIVLIAHSAVVKIEDPIHPAYDRNTFKLHKKISAKMEEYPDIIGFCALRTLLTTEKSGFDKTRNRAISTGEHVMYISPTASIVAKNRYRMPEVIPLEWDAMEKLLPEDVQKTEQTKNEKEN